eukprot:CAMPEP_0195072492 /NCGR_PEP_ID=MMETSP0448-20130528/16064_1 /TAXON_ID=66468 /ORGANISM="Heterocapsa triquestra, Strain CCMP 448" /LENGTH=655 /DNA_ID=CAMNT_0040104491 /DNA_START=23 /DNA_END=1990 /DNA_ORIENTATION=+
MAFAAPVVPHFGPPGCTTVMLRNIPNRYPRDMLIERLNESYKGQYDFVYLPIDFNSKCNVGYAFINFRTPHMAQMFVQEFHGKRTKNVLPGFGSSKVCEVSYARVQGRDANMENLRDEKFIEKLNERPEWQPLFFDAAGKEIPFSKTLGGGSKRKGKGGATPMGGMGTPAGYMGYSPFGAPMMYPPGAFGMPPRTPVGKASAPVPPPEPTKTLAEVLPNATAETMLMVKEVPTTATQQSLIDKLNKTYIGAYDFIYLPKDTKSDGNRGFFFVNFRKPEKVEQFTKEYNNVKVGEAFAAEADAEKVCEVVSARLHSLEGSIARAQSSMMKAAAGGSASDRAAWSPLLFTNDGLSKTFPRLAMPAPGAKKEKTEEEKAEAAERAEKKKEEKKDKEKAEAEERKAETTEGASASAAAETAEGAEEEKKKEKGEAKTPKAKAKGEGKGEGKGKKEKTPRSMMMPGTPGGGMGYPGFPPGYAGYPPGYGAPGYGFGPGAAGQAYMAHAMAVQRTMMAQAAASQAAAAYGAYGGGMMPGMGSPAMNAPQNSSSRLNNEQKINLRKQIEFYFSTNNLDRDVYLRKHMDTSTGYVPIGLMVEFSQVKKYRTSIPELLEVIGGSKKLEMDATRKVVRLRDEKERKKWVDANVKAKEAEASATPS